MSVRWENSPAFDESANEVGVTLEANDKRWAGVAIFKNAYKVYRQRAYSSKMLICSVRMGPEVDGVMRTWHLEYTAGANAVFTLPPVYLTKLFTEGDHLDFESRIWDDIPTDVMTRLQKVPYFKKAYDPDGMTIEEFNDHAPLIATWQEFSKATDNMIAFVNEVMEKL
jgi:transaldolase